MVVVVVVFVVLVLVIAFVVVCVRLERVAEDPRVADLWNQGIGAKCKVFAVVRVVRELWANGDWGSKPATLR